MSCRCSVSMLGCKVLSVVGIEGGGGRKEAERRARNKIAGKPTVISQTAPINFKPCTSLRKRLTYLGIGADWTS